MLPFEPEYIKDLRARYAEALDRTYDCRDPKRLPNPLPSALRRHVFDCYDGMRLIISRDLMADGNTYLHVSCSYMRNRPSVVFTSGGEVKGWEPYKVKILDRFAEISGDTDGLVFIGFTAGKLIPHFFRNLG